MLSYSDKSLRKLQENFACFADKLGEEDVYQSFTIVMSNAKKFAKIETKVSWHIEAKAPVPLRVFRSNSKFNENLV